MQNWIANGYMKHWKVNIPCREDKIPDDIVQYMNMACFYGDKNTNGFFRKFQSSSGNLIKKLCCNLLT